MQNTATAHITDARPSALENRRLLDLAHALTERAGITVDFADLAALIAHGSDIGASPQAIRKAHDRLSAAAMRGNPSAVRLLAEISA